ncbi:hypothetical protein ACQP2T_28065 [Nonomuraea sp. CA-143628]|uniref:hypothetical protein n=1 Tax=Nonomuraea sp. CA-143628 TaxID=3239997 RepID=UPI003D9154F3
MADLFDVLVELFINGSWVDVTTDVRIRDGVSIGRGQSDEGSRSEASRLTLSFNNRLGKYSPRNPTSAYYGLLGRNTPIRVTAESSVRFVGEVSSWPPRWDITGNDVWTPVEASGILRRLGQGAAPLRSALYRGLTNPALAVPVVAYWPCEDGDGSSRLASGVGGPSMTFTGTPDLASYTEFDSSDPIPLLADSVWTGVVPAYTVTGDASIRFLLAVPAAGISGDEALISIYGSGTAAQWVIRYGDPGGDLKVQAYDEDGNVLLDSGFMVFAVTGKKLRVALDLDQNGANIDWDLSILEPGATSGLTAGGTLASRTLGQVQRIIVSVGGGITDTAIGHISVQSAITSIFDLGPQLAAYTGETAGRRIERLCDEEQITFTSVGTLDDSTAMGPQKPATLLDLIGDAADADMGILYEARNQVGLAYRTRSSLYNQAAAVALDYDARHLSPPLEPVDDDQNVRNDVTVTRNDGSSARAVVTTGPLSTAAPPNGVGRYDEQVTVNVAADTDLPDQANWRAHLGTVDEARYPQVTVNLASPGVSSDAALTADVIALDVGDRLTIDNPPSFLPPDQISQIARGYTETLTPKEWSITVNCTPETPYQVGVYGTDRYGTEYATLNSSATSSATSLSVATSKGPLWTTAAGDMPFDIAVGGEQMTVTAISGSSSPQTFTVTRHVNGVTKSHAAGAVLKLFTPAIRAL